METIQILANAVPSYGAIFCLALTIWAVERYLKAFYHSEDILAKSMNAFWLILSVLFTLFFTYSAAISVL